MSPKLRAVKINSLKRKSDRRDDTPVKSASGTPVGVKRQAHRDNTSVVIKQEVEDDSYSAVFPGRRASTHQSAYDDGSEDSDAGSTYTNKISEKGTCLPFGLLPPVTKEVITYMEALLQYMKEMYRAEGESSTAPPVEIPHVSDDVKLGGPGKVEIYPHSHCYISKSKMTAILLRADEDPENWTKLTRAILEEVYGKDLANLSAKGTRGSQGIYVPLYNALFALVNDRLRLLNKSVSDHEFTKRINKICSNMRGAVKRTSGASGSSTAVVSAKAVKIGRGVPAPLTPTLPNIQHSISSPDLIDEEDMLSDIRRDIQELRNIQGQRGAPEMNFECVDDDRVEDCSVMMPVNVQLEDTGEVEVFPQSQCFISKSKMNAILLRADEDPDNWIKLTRYILEEVYGEDLANLSAKGTRGSQGIYTPLYNAIYALVNDRLRLRNKVVSEHEFNKRINKICSNKRGAVKRAARRTDIIPAGLMVGRPYNNETDDEVPLDESYEQNSHLSVSEILKNKSELIVTTR